MLTQSRGEKWHKSKWNPGRTLTFSPPSPGSVTRRRWRTWWTWPYLRGRLKQLTQDLIFIHSFLKYWLWGSSWSMNVRLCRLILFPKKKRRDRLKVIKLIFESCCCWSRFFFSPSSFSCVMWNPTSLPWTSLPWPVQSGSPSCWSHSEPRSSAPHVWSSAEKKGKMNPLD